MAIDIKGLNFNPEEDVTITARSSSGSEVITPTAIDCQAAGLMVTWTEPNPPSGTIRHYRFIPYEAVLRVSQSYVEA